MPGATFRGSRDEREPCVREKTCFTQMTTLGKKLHIVPVADYQRLFQEHALKRKVGFISTLILYAREMLTGRRIQGSTENIRVYSLVYYIKVMYWQLQPFDDEDGSGSLFLFSSVFSCRPDLTLLFRAELGELLQSFILTRVQRK